VLYGARAQRSQAQRATIGSKLKALFAGQ
jgi:hypothetical protein